MTRLLGISIGLLLLVASAAAQDFVFVSNRIRANPEVGESGNRLYQNELYRYLNGSEIRLTFTPGKDEWDPSLSPSGRYLAYLVSDVVDWAVVTAYDWHWHLRIMDLESGLLVEEWPLPGADGAMRIAGGFDIVWHPNEQSLLVQLVDLDSLMGSIARYQVGEPEPRVLSRGFGIHVDESRGWIATWLDGYVTVFDPTSGSSYSLVMGEPMGWLDGQVVVGGQGPLVLMDPVTAEQTVIARQGDYIGEFVSSPDGSRHAWTVFSLDGSSSVITVSDADFNVLAEWLHDGYLEHVSWLGSGSLLMTGLEEDHLVIRELRIDDGAEYMLVGAFSDNLLPVVVPLGGAE